MASLPQHERLVDVTFWDISGRFAMQERCPLYRCWLAPALPGFWPSHCLNRAAEALYDVVVHRCRRFRPADTLEAADHDLAVLADELRVHVSAVVLDLEDAVFGPWHDF